MDRIGLVDSINTATISIDFGRKGFATRGKEQEDAFLALQAVEELGYKTVDKACPHNGKYRVIGYPKDSFHIACIAIAHKTRLQNILRTPGVDSIEKALLKQRFVNLSAAQNGYIEMQKKILTN